MLSTDVVIPMPIRYILVINIHIVVYISITPHILICFMASNAMIFFLHLSLIFYSLIVSNDNDFDSNTKALGDDKRKQNIMAFEAMKQMKLCGVIEMYTTMSIFITSIHVSYGHWDYRSRRKQTRVPIMF